MKYLLIILILISQFANAQPTANAGIDQTIILPMNYCVIYGGFPYSRKSSATAISSFSWSQVSGPNTATLSRRLDTFQAINTSDSVVFVSGLIQGTYTFRLQVTDANGTSQDDMQVIVQAAPALNTNTKSITITNGVYHPNNAQTALNINRGDTIFLDGNLLDSTDNIELGNIHGSAAQPIYIMAKNAPVKINRLQLGNSGWAASGDIRFSYIIIDGRLNGTPHSINSKQFLLYSGHHVELRYCRSDYSFQSAIHVAGYLEKVKTDLRDQLKFPAMFRVGYYIHDNIVNLATFEGLYGGPTALTNQGWDTVRYHPRGDSIFIYNNVITNTGNDAIQVSGFYRAWIFNNSTYNNGTAGSGGQGSAINLGTMASGYVYNNYLRRSWRNGSFLNGYGTIVYQNNYLDSCAFYETGGGNAVIYVNSSQHNPERTPPRTVTVQNNYFRNPYSTLYTGLSAKNFGDNSTTFRNNFIWRPNGGTDWYYFSDPEVSITGNQSVSNINWPSWPLPRVCGPTLMGTECVNVFRKKFKVKMRIR